MSESQGHSHWYQLEGSGFTGFQVFTGLRCSRFEKPVRSKNKKTNKQTNRKIGFYRGHNYQYHAAGT